MFLWCLFRNKWHRGTSSDRINAFCCTFQVAMINYPTVQLFECLTVQLFINCSTVQLSYCSTILLFNCLNVHLFNCSTVQLFNSSTVQQFKCSNVQRPISLSSNYVRDRSGWPSQFISNFGTGRDRPNDSQDLKIGKIWDFPRLFPAFLA